MLTLQRLLGNHATTRLIGAVLQRDPTFGNLPLDAPAEGTSGLVVRLKKIGGVWKEQGVRYSRTARGNYDFVVKDHELFAVKAKKTMAPAGHTEAARGGRVSFAGQVEFEGGKLKAWNDGSGHYRPAAADPAATKFRQSAVDAGLDEELFSRHPSAVQRPRPPGERVGPQLPVEQPATHPRTPGEPPKVGSGPPDWKGFEERYGKGKPGGGGNAPPVATGETPTSGPALTGEATSVLKVEGRTAGLLGKIGTGAGWVADFMLPGPQDAIILMIQFAMSYKEAQDAARARGLRSGFGWGLAAGLLGLRRGWVRDHLAPHTVSMDVATEVSATTGYREKGLIQGLSSGLAFAEQLSGEQRKALLQEAVRMLRSHGEQVRLRDWWERGYTDTDVIEISAALAPRIDEVLEAARENQELKERAKEIERLKKWGPLAPVAPYLE